MAFNRRQLVVGAGAALAVPGLARAAPPRAGVAPAARQSIGVIGTIAQDGLSLVGFGWLTEVAGLGARDLFTDPLRRAPPIGGCDVVQR